MPLFRCFIIAFVVFQLDAFIFSPISTFSNRNTFIRAESSGKFVLTDYVQRTLLQRKWNEPPLVQSQFATLSDIFPFDSDDFDEGKNYIVLVDLSVRSIEDLQALKTPFLAPLVAKMKSVGEDVTKDKFMYVHDIGRKSVCRAAVARIPTEGYQKLGP
jgi:hypothetical protein